MKGLKYIITALSVTGLLFAAGSCKKDNGGAGRSGRYVTFTSAIVGSKHTKASGTSWGNDDIGIYMLKASAAMTPGNVIYANKKYSTPGSGNFSPAATDQAVYFPYDGSNVDFIAYYPYTTAITDYAFTVDVSDQSDLSAIDVMYSANARGLNKSSATTSLGFSHMLTILVFEMNNVTGEDISDIRVTISGMKTVSTFSLTDGSLTDNAASVADIGVRTSVSAASAVGTAIVLPVAGLEGAKVKINIPSLGRYYEWEVPHGQNYLGKHKYTYELNLKGETLEVVNPQGTITDWISTPKEIVTLDPQAPPSVGGDGSADNPFTADQLAGNVGLSGKWVTGYVAGVSYLTRSGGFSAPFTSKQNILIAAKAGETDFSKCISVELQEGSDIQAALNLVDNEALLGKTVKVRGNIVADLFGADVGVKSLTGQSGGNKPPASTDPVTYFNENFGTNVASGSYDSYISAHTDWSMGAPVVYSDSYNTAKIKKASFGTEWTTQPLLLLPRGVDSQLKIENIPAGYKSITLTYDIAPNTGNANAKIVVIKANGIVNSLQPDKDITSDGPQTVELTIPDNTTSLEFFSAGSVNTCDIRIDNIKLTGIAVK